MTIYTPRTVEAILREHPTETLILFERVQRGITGKRWTSRKPHKPKARKVAA